MGTFTSQLNFLKRNMQSFNQRVLMSRVLAPQDAKYFHGGGINVGNRFRGTSTEINEQYPSGASPNAAYKTDAVWTHFLPWGVLFPGELHKSTNTKCVLSYIKYGFWSDVYSGWTIATYDAEYGSKHLSKVSANTVNDPVNYSYDGAQKLASFYFTSNFNPIHFWKLGRVLVPNVERLKCVYVEMAATLALIDDQGVDDRDKSEYMITAAADMYPNDTEVMTNIPMVGSSRFVRVRNDLTKINFATVSPPGVEWYRNSEYEGRVSLTEEEFIATDPIFLPTA